MPFRPTPAIIPALVALALAHGPLPAQAFPTPAPEDARSMLAELARSQEGWNAGSLADHVAFYVDSVTFMTARGPRPGRDRVVEEFSRSYFRDGRPLQALSFDRVAIRALGPDHALMTGNFHLRGGGREEQQGWFTLVWMRTADGWRVIHDHSS